MQCLLPYWLHRAAHRNALHGNRLPTGPLWADHSGERTGVKCGSPPQGVHDVSDGGLAVAPAGSACAGELGRDLRLSDLAAQSGLAPWELLFSESPCRLVVMVSPLHAPDFERRFAGLPLYRLGTVTTNDRLAINGPGGVLWIDGNLGKLKAAWRKTLREL